MRILIVSSGTAHHLYGGALQKGFQDLGHEANTFIWNPFFKDAPTSPRPPNPLQALRWAALRAQNKVMAGPAVTRLNTALLTHIRRTRPQLIFLYRPTHILPSTLAKIRQFFPKTIVMTYNNDDPFSAAYPKYLWRHFLKGLPHAHHIFAYRIKNLEDYAAAGFTHTSLLRAYYLPQENKPVKAKPTAEISFIGHYENDGRDETILHLIRHGICVALHGTLWENSPHYAAFCKHMGAPITPVYQSDYTKALCSAPMALVFLSKLNNDTYTRRCFEIPATGTLMLAPFTPDLAANLFKPNTEAIYFTSKEDLLAKVKHLLQNPKEMKKITAAAHARLEKDGHTPTHRAQHILDMYQTLKSK